MRQVEETRQEVAVRDMIQIRIDATREVTAALRELNHALSRSRYVKEFGRDQLLAVGVELSDWLAENGEF
jgi:hypothetical protein